MNVNVDQYNDDYITNFFQMEKKRVDKEYGENLITLRYSSTGNIGYFCQLCSIECSDQNELVSHCSGIIHRKKASYLKQGLNPNQSEIQGKNDDMNVIDYEHAIPFAPPPPNFSKDSTDKRAKRRPTEGPLTAEGKIMDIFSIKKWANRNEKKGTAQKFTPQNKNCVLNKQSSQLCVKKNQDEHLSKKTSGLEFLEKIDQNLLDKIDMNLLNNIGKIMNNPSNHISHPENTNEYFSNNSKNTPILPHSSNDSHHFESFTPTKGLGSQEPHTSDGRKHSTHLPTGRLPSKYSDKQDESLKNHNEKSTSSNGHRNYSSKSSSTTRQSRFHTSSSDRVDRSKSRSPLNRSSYKNLVPPSPPSFSIPSPRSLREKYSPSSPFKEDLQEKKQSNARKKIPSSNSSYGKSSRSSVSKKSSSPKKSSHSTRQKISFSLRKRSRSPTTSSKLAGTTTGNLIEKLSECGIHSERDVDLGLAIASTLVKSLREHFFKEDNSRMSEIMMDAELKLGAAKTLRTGFNPDLSLDSYGKLFSSL